jgi:hypothetical protein
MNYCDCPKCWVRPSDEFVALKEENYNLKIELATLMAKLDEINRKAFDPYGSDTTQSAPNDERQDDNSVQFPW